MAILSPADSHRRQGSVSRPAWAAWIAALAGVSSLAAGAPCPPSAPPTGMIVRVTTDAELQAAVRSLASGTTLLIADGTYVLSNTLHLQGGIRDVSLRGESGNRDAVILRG